MAFQDRAYYRDSNRGGGGNPLMWLLNGSVSLGSWFGIHVRLHASLLILVGVSLLFPSFLGGAYNSVTFCTILFGTVLLHEFGHCAASRMVGGSPTDILLTPLGGLAFVDAPRRAWATFVAVAGGPLVNVLICAICAMGLIILNRAYGMEVPWNPLKWGTAMIPLDRTGYYLWWIYAINCAILLFNLWPVFPLDGGQMLQSLLWVKMGYYKSMNIACTVGIAGAIVMGIVGIAFWHGQLLMIFIAASCLITCISLRNQIKAAGPWAFEEEEDVDYSASQWNETPVKSKRRRVSKRALRKAQRFEREAEIEQARIDNILAKVSAHGMKSLNWREKRALHKATERQRMGEKL